jgi:xanthosine utilization system XapX-like protein
MDLLGLLEAIIIIGILVGIVYAIVQWVPMPAPFKTIAYGVLALVCIVILFNFLRGGDLGSFGTVRIR